MKEKVPLQRLKVKVKVTQLCLTLCDPVDYIVHGIFQTRILEWVSSPFSMGSAQPRNWTGVSCTAGGFFISWATREAHYSITKVTRSSKLEKRLRERDKKSVTIKAAETLSLMKKKKKKSKTKKSYTEFTTELSLRLFCLNDPDFFFSTSWMKWTLKWFLAVHAP